MGEDSSATNVVTNSTVNGKVIYAPVTGEKNARHVLPGV